MTDLLIQPRKLQGTVNIPPSKSMAHRAVIAASLANGQSTIHNIQLSDDIRATIAGMEDLGAKLTIIPEGDRSRLEIQGIETPDLNHESQIDANESGSTLRFLIPLASVLAGTTHFSGRGKLGSRPLDTYADIFAAQGLTFNKNEGPLLDLTIKGALQAGHYELAGNVSSQFITGLLFTLPLLEGDSTLQITTELESIGYIDLTLAVLNQFGITIHFDRAARRFEIPGQQTYQATTYTVEGDFSQAAFFIVAGALGNEVTITGLDLSSQQGDREITAFVEAMGAEIEIKQETNELKVTAKHLSATPTLDGAQVPDIIPVTALAACLSQGSTQIINLERLRIKESDRLAATQAELAKLGANIQVDGDSLVIQGVETLAGDATVWSYQDHRMAMMLAIASTVCEKAIILQDSECVSKSYPNFWEDFTQLGGEVSEWNLG